MSETLAILCYGQTLSPSLGFIHKPRYVVNILGIFDPPPPSWSLLLNKAYVIKWSFGQPPYPSTVHVVYECPLVIPVFLKGGRPKSPVQKNRRGATVTIPFLTQRFEVQIFQSPSSFYDELFQSQAVYNNKLFAKMTNIFQSVKLERSECIFTRHYYLFLEWFCL